MRRNFLKRLAGLAICGITTRKLALAGASGQGEAAAPAPRETIHCRALESGGNGRLGVTWVIFHHRDAADRARLGELLRQLTAASVEFQTPDGQWHAAAVERLKTCFGRGLLLFPAGSARLAEKDEFLLRIPKGKNPATSRTEYLMPGPSGWFSTSFSAAFYLLAAMVLVSRPAVARLDLPQRPLIVKLGNEAAVPARNQFGSPAGFGELPSSLEQILVASLPADFRDACREMIGAWGDNFAHTAEWRVFELHRQPKQVWLAFRCGSHLPDYGQHYDERLALLRLDAATLEFLPNGPDADNDSALYHLEFAELPPIKGTEATAFRVTQPGENPCCDGGDKVSEERLVVYTDSPHGIVEALSAVTRREVYSHDDIEGDAETVYHAQVSFERDAQGRVTSAAATFREEVNGKLQRSGTLRYRWNPTAYRFEELK